MAAAEQVAGRAPTEVEKRDVAARLERLRKSISAFHRARLKTGEYLMGMRKMRYPQAQGIEVARSLRSPVDEERAVGGLRSLNQLLLGRDPTVAEMEAGVAVQETGLGIIPALPATWVAVTAIAGGAWSLSSIFDALTERERRIQRELNPSAAFWSDVANTAATWVLPVLIVGGVVVGGWYLWSRMKKGKGRKRKGKLQSKRPAKKLPPKPAEKEKEE